MARRVFSEGGNIFELIFLSQNTFFCTRFPCKRALAITFAVEPSSVTSLIAPLSNYFYRLIRLEFCRFATCFNSRPLSDNSLWCSRWSWLGRKSCKLLKNSFLKFATFFTGPLDGWRLVHPKTWFTHPTDPVGQPPFRPPRLRHSNFRIRHRCNPSHHAIRTDDNFPARDAVSPHTGW